MPLEITIETLKQRALEAGLHLTDGELERLTTGVARSRLMASALRELLSDTLEPAPVFTAGVASK